MITYTYATELQDTQIPMAAKLLMKYVMEENFWVELASYMKDSGATDDLITNEADIRDHLKWMFQFSAAKVNIVTYKTRNPLSSVLGYAEGNKIFENTRKLLALTLAERVGHLGHETTHLFGYSHDVQGDKHSATVLFGKCMEMYAEKRLKEVSSAGIY